ncbi:MAG: SH3 domain-containing protein [Planctomycetia bacterium]|nr:SH3 domain-containing protein [Planctomycetia bacterium]
MVPFLGLLLLASAQREGIVKADVADVRAGQSDKFYVTNRLRRGTKVEIIEECPGGWLKIKPPLGSFSYINVRFLDRIASNQPNYAVVALKNQLIPVFIGSEILSNRRPDIAGARLKEGTQVVSIGPPLQDAEGYWMPIEPPPSEVRYLLAAALESSATGTTFTAAASTPVPPSTGPLPAPKHPSANDNRTPEQEWAEAAAAERQHNYPEAIRLYAALGARTASSHPQLSAAALQQAAWLQQMNRANPRATISSSTTKTSTSNSSGQAAGSPTNPGAYRVRLARAGWSIDGKPTYRMDVLSRGIYQEAGYAISSGTQINLEAWLNREVEVTGSLWYHGQARRNVLTVNSIRVVP